jgi:hypothetical protein
MTSTATDSATGEPSLSLDGRRFRALENSAGGQVGGETKFFFS